jgi:hypothetical protein
MKLRPLLIALSFLALPVAIRALWFYQGFYQPSKIDTPDYASLEMPLPDISTPLPQNTIDNFPNPESKPLVLFDAIHNNIFSLSEVEALIQGLTNKGSEVRLTSSDSLEDQLKKTSAFIIIAPTLPYDSWEIQTISRFVKRGGHLLVITDPTRNFNYSDIGNLSDSSPQPPTSLSIDITNQLLEPYGVAFTNDYLYNLSENEGNFRNIILKNFNKDKLTTGLSKVVLYSVHSIKTNQTSLIFGDNSTLSSQTDQGGDLIVAASASQGRILIIGDLTFMTSPYNQVADNGKLIDNISEFLTTSEKIRDLNDHPYLFNKPVTLIRGKDIKLDKTFLDALNDLKVNLVGPKLSITIGIAPVDGHDLFIMDTYPPSSELRSYIGEFGIEFNAETVEELESLNNDMEETPQPSPTPTLTPKEENGNAEKGVINSIFIPGFGLLNSSEVGVILFNTNDGQNTLTLLANSAEHINILSGLISSDLSTCNIQEKIAVCAFDGSENDTDYNTDNLDSNYYNENEVSPSIETATHLPETTGTPTGPIGGISWLANTPTPAR